MPSPQNHEEALVADLRAAIQARAAGLWHVEPTRLVLRAFVPAPDLDETVAQDFADATRSLRRDQRHLGIVEACAADAVVVSRAAALPAEIGSGRWLRAFHATRSVAVPLHDASGRVIGILSVALGDDPRGDDDVAAVVREHGGRWLPS